MRPTRAVAVPLTGLKKVETWLWHHSISIKGILVANPESWSGTVTLTHTLKWKARGGGPTVRRCGVTVGSAQKDPHILDAPKDHF